MRDRVRAHSSTAKTIRRRTIGTLGVLTALAAASTGTAAHAASARPSTVPAAVVRPNCVPAPDGSGCQRVVTGTSEASGLNIRSGPFTGFTSVGSMPYKSTATVYCYLPGSDVNGDSYWDYIDYAGSSGYVSDYWLYTGGAITGQVSQCTDVPGQARESGGLPMYSSNGSGTVNGVMPYDAVGLVECYVTGPSVGGDDDWDLIGYGGAYGYVSDYWLYTGTDITRQVEPCI